jgi:hypothetical protein
VPQRIPTFDITFVGHARGEVRAANGMLGLVIDGTFEDLLTPDVILFPGGAGTRQLQSDARVLDWVRNLRRFDDQEFQETEELLRLRQVLAAVHGRRELSAAGTVVCDDRAGREHGFEPFTGAAALVADRGDQEALAAHMARSLDT